MVVQAVIQFLRNMRNKEIIELQGTIFELEKKISKLQSRLSNVIVYSEMRGQFLGQVEWVSATPCAKSFDTTDAARTEVRRRTPKGETENIVLLNFVNREVVGLTGLFTPAARQHYNKVMTEA